MRIKHLIYSTVVSFLTTTTGIGTIAAQTSVTATEDLQFNMKADSREGFVRCDHVCLPGRIHVHARENL